MKVIDSTPGHRALTVNKDEVIDSETIALALAAHGLHTPEEANDLASIMFDSLEEMLLFKRIAA